MQLFFGHHRHVSYYGGIERIGVTGQWSILFHPLWQSCLTPLDGREDLPQQILRNPDLTEYPSRPAQSLGKLNVQQSQNYFEFLMKISENPLSLES